VQSFEPLDDQHQILLLTGSVFKGLDELAGLELALPETLRPVPIDFTTYQLAKDFADRAVASGGTEVGPHVIGDLHPCHPISALAPRACVCCRFGRLRLRFLQPMRF
jgi:hypothetical protein